MLFFRMFYPAKPKSEMNLKRTRKINCMWSSLAHSPKNRRKQNLLEIAYRRKQYFSDIAFERDTPI